MAVKFHKLLPLTKFSDKWRMKILHLDFLFKG